eukprot:2159670-Amphidinium_carterae.1
MSSSVWFIKRFSALKLSPSAKTYKLTTGKKRAESRTHLRVDGFAMRFALGSGDGCNKKDQLPSVQLEEPSDLVSSNLAKLRAVGHVLTFCSLVVWAA